jgi:hypothetical protein
MSDQQADEFHRMHGRMEDLHKGMEAGYQSAKEDGWTLGRIVDPVRAAALHEAVQFACAWPTDPPDADGVLQIAERFEAWLAGPEAE